MVDPTPPTSEPAPDPTTVAGNAEYLRWSLERVRELTDSYVETQRHMEKKAYNSAAAFAVVLAVGIGMCDGLCRPWGSVSLVLIALTALATTVLLWCTAWVRSSEDLNPEALWSDALKPYPVEGALRTANSSAVDAAQSQLAEAIRKSKWALWTQVAAVSGIAVTLLTVIVLRLNALQ